MNLDPIAILTDWGGLGLLAVAFMWLLRSVLADKKALAEIIANHLTALVKQQEAITEALKENTQQMKVVTWEMGRCRHWREGAEGVDASPPPNPPFITSSS